MQILEYAPSPVWSLSINNIHAMHASTVGVCGVWNLPPPKKKKIEFFKFT